MTKALLSLWDLFDAVLQCEKVDYTRIVARDRHQNVTFLRHTIMYLAMKSGVFTQSEVATAMQRDHSSVAHAVKRIELLHLASDAVSNNLCNRVARIERFVKEEWERRSAELEAERTGYTGLGTG